MWPDDLAREIPWKRLELPDYSPDFAGTRLLLENNLTNLEKSLVFEAEPAGALAL